MLTHLKVRQASDAPKGCDRSGAHGLAVGCVCVLQRKIYVAEAMLDTLLLSDSTMTTSSSLTSAPSPKRLRLTLADSSSSGSISRPLSAATILLEQQLDSLQTQLEQTRRMAKLEKQEVQQERDQWKSKAVQAMKECGEAKDLLSEYKETNAGSIEKLQQARDTALQQALTLQRRVEALEMDRQDQYENAEIHSDYNRLKGEIEVQNQRERSLLKEVDELRAKLVEQAKLHLQQRTEEHHQKIGDMKSSISSSKLSEDAPPQLMKELAAQRIKVSDAERRQRQLQRSVQSLEQRNGTLIKQLEQAKLKAQREPGLQERVDELEKEVNQQSAMYKGWVEFGGRLARTLGAKGGSSIMGSSSSLVAPPPEATRVVRSLEKLQKKVEEQEKELIERKSEIEKLQDSIFEKESKLKEFDELERQWKTTKSNHELVVASKEQEISTWQSKCSIYQNEAESLRTLMETMEKLPGKQPVIDSAAADKLTLKAVQSDLRTTQQERERLAKELDKALATEKAHRADLDRVRSKFINLREALAAEKRKVSIAEGRAHEAEQRAGQGSFDADRTRVLHFETTPLVQTLKEEVDVLKRRLAQACSSSSQQTHHDPDKLNQRLKQNFKEQIALFREGVYLMTGFKIDMIPGTGSEPTFKVRSLYGEREQDHLIFQRPSGSKAGSTAALNLLVTDWANELSKTPFYDYMSKCHSTPAFLASVQLNLFEKQTVMIA